MTAIELSGGAIKLHRDTCDDLAESTLVNALWALEDRDTCFFSEPWQCGDLEAYPLHNCRLDACYSLTSADLERLEAGKVVTLNPHAPEVWEREELEKEEANA
jgi:hypothetical protein|nr:MAG TPA: hypothetical protein [Caudoviricetes sp.]